VLGREFFFQVADQDYFRVMDKCLALLATRELGHLFWELQLVQAVKEAHGLPLLVLPPSIRAPHVPLVSGRHPWERHRLRCVWIVIEEHGPQLFVQVLHQSVLNVLWVNFQLSLALNPY
jgi:hypothetical protein